MPDIRPISDLRYHAKEVTQDALATQKPVFLTRNGVGTLVLMSMEAYEKGLYESEVYDKLREAELQSKTVRQRRTHDEVMAAARARLKPTEEGAPHRA